MTSALCSHPATVVAAVTRCTPSSATSTTATAVEKSASNPSRSNGKAGSPSSQRSPQRIDNYAIARPGARRPVAVPPPRGPGEAASSIAKAMRVLDNDSDHINTARGPRPNRSPPDSVEAGRTRVAATHIDDQGRRLLAEASLVVSRARAVVPRHGYGRREIDGVPVIEEVPRLARQFGLLVRGLLALGFERDAAVGAASRGPRSSPSRTPAAWWSTPSQTANRSPWRRSPAGPAFTVMSCGCNARSCK